MFSAPPNSEYSFQLFGIGRDGKNVVVTSFSDMGRPGEAPVARFTKTAKTAKTAKNAKNAKSAKSALKKAF